MIVRAHQGAAKASAACESDNSMQWIGIDKLLTHRTLVEKKVASLLLSLHGSVCTCII